MALPSGCAWTLDDEDNNVYATSCGGLFKIHCDGPIENGMRFCCYCGKRLEAVTHE